MLGSLTTEVSMAIDLSWSEMLLLYGAQVVLWFDGLTKIDLMVLLGAFLLGQYFGSKRDVEAKDSGK